MVIEQLFHTKWMSKYQKNGRTGYSLKIIQLLRFLYYIVPNRIQNHHAKKAISDRRMDRS